MAKPAKEQAPRPRCRAVNITFINGLKPTIGGWLKISHGHVRLIGPAGTSPGVRRHAADKLACSNQRRKSAPAALISPLLSYKDFSLELSVLPMGSKKVNAEFRQQGLLQAF